MASETQGSEQDQALKVEALSQEIQSTLSAASCNNAYAQACSVCGFTCSRVGAVCPFQALKRYVAKVQEHREFESRVKKLRETVKKNSVDYDKSEEPLDEL